ESLSKEVCLAVASGAHLSLTAIFCVRFLEIPLALKCLMQVAPNEDREKKARCRLRPQRRDAVSGYHRSFSAIGFLTDCDNHAGRRRWDAVTGSDGGMPLGLSKAFDAIIDQRGCGGTPKRRLSGTAGCRSNRGPRGIRARQVPNSFMT